MSIKHNLTLFSAVSVFALANVSCSNEARMKDAQNIVINEIMPSNRTGLLTDKGKTADWIELKNTSSDTIDLKGFELAVTRTPKPIKEDKKADDKKKGDDENADESAEEVTEEVTTTWEFPSVKIGGGETLVVFAGNAKKSAPEKGIMADLKLPKEGGKVQFLGPRGKVVSEVSYDKMSPDQALARVEGDTTYVKTYWQSPGFDNNREGYEKANIRMDEQRKSPLVIWELMSRSKKSNENWVELKNISKEPIELSQYALSKKGGKNDCWSLPSRTLQPGEIVTIQLMGKRANTNAMQAPFKIGNAETIVLTKDGKFVDGMCAKATTVGSSIGRSNGAKGFFFFSTPTRGEENGSAGRRYIAEAPQFDIAPGVYSKDNRLSLRLKNKDSVVHYTLDGSEPTSSSPVLKDSIVIDKSTVIRSFAEGDTTTLRSKTATTTYLLGVNHSVPVINISVNRNDLYDYNTGIYADGPGYSPEWPHKGANYYQNWTKKAHVEFFDDKADRDGFSVDCGLKIFGGFSRYENKKSFRLKFRGEYGDSEVDYDFFDNGQPLELEDLVLRSGSQDYNRCMVRDEFFTSLMKENSPTLITQIYRPVALYVNAEYFGLYFIREKIDNHFVSRQLNVPTDSINMIASKYLQLGSEAGYKDMMSFVNNNDMSNPQNYEKIRSQVDLQGLIDYKLGEIYSGNTDVGNIRYVQSTANASDKKWHFIFFDLDASWVGYKPSAEYYLSLTPSVGGVRVHNELIGRLLANKDFRDLFMQRLSHHMTNTFSTKNATAVFDKLVERIRPEMKMNCERWPELSYDQWEKNISDFRAKFKDKNKVMMDDLRGFLHITDAENQKYFSKLGY